MKLKLKNINWYAGHPTVILGNKTAKKMNVFVNDRVSIRTSRKKVYAVVNIVPKLVKDEEIGVSDELSKILKTKTGKKIEVRFSELSNASFLINKKINGGVLTSKELSFLISEIVHNNLTEAEIAFFTAAEKLKGMNFEETISLTKAMVKTGARLKFKKKYVADKHCIGGIAGNRTTPIVISICAALGITLPKTSSRAITSAAGTADVIETISNVELPLKKIIKVVEEKGACLAWGGSLGLAPSDDKIIQVERLLNLDVEPQLLASVMAKKVSAGAKHILIDIPYGDGAKIKSKKDAEKLGRKFYKIAKRFNLKMKVAYTDGTQPIGNGIGPILEMLDIIEVFQNRGPEDLKKKSLLLATELTKLCGITNAKQKTSKALSSGAAYEKFKEIINAQNGKKDFDKRIKKLKPAKFRKIISANKSGKITHISNKGISALCRILGTPETISAGVYLHKHVGKVRKGDYLLTLYTESKTKMEDATKFLKEFNPIKIK
jgi:AMP phosphorylase